MFLFFHYSLVNVSASWLLEHREAYRSWAASAEGAAQVARATLACPAPLRSALTLAEEQRVLAALDDSAARGDHLELERQELTSRVQQLEQEARQLQEEIEAVVARERLMWTDCQQTKTLCRQRCEEAEGEVAAARQALAAAEEREDELRQQLARSESLLHFERRTLNAVAGAAQAAELAAAEAVGRLRSRAPPKMPSLLTDLLRQTVAGNGNSSRARRSARQLLDWLATRRA